jgi:hypothetical protein
MRVNHRPATMAGALLVAVVTGLAAHRVPAPAPRHQAQPSGDDAIAISIFQQRVADYVTLHRLLEGGIAAMRPTTDMEELHVNMRALASRIRAARENAKQGDIFAPAATTLIRRQIAAAVPPEEWAALLAEQAVDEDGRPIAIPELRVNMDWPARVPYNYVPARLLKALPSLPPELQFRIIGRALVLWDHHANLIVDFIPGAIVT